MRNSTITRSKKIRSWYGRSSFQNKRYYILNIKFFNQPHEIVFRSLVNLIKKIGKKYYPPRGKSIDQLLLKFRSGQIRKINISGCILEKIDNSFIIYEEK